jgi:hypothetical protein
MRVGHYDYGDRPIGEASINIDHAEGVVWRRATRFPVRLPAQLFRSHAYPVAITITDLSRAGLGIALPVAVRAGQPVAIVTGSVSIFASVRHCGPTSNGRFWADVEIRHLVERAVEQPPAAA